jgi:Cu/Zn superoxide dismutase
MRHLVQGFLAGIAIVALSTAASAQQKNFTAALAGASEVPPATGSGKGTAQVTLDPASKSITYTIEYSGLSGPATAAHIHGPAATGANAGVVTPLGAAGPASPIKGTAKLTDAQIADLEAGKNYVNVHTEANKGGEIRGQLAPAK